MNGMFSFRQEIEYTYIYIPPHEVSLTAVQRPGMHDTLALGSYYISSVQR